MSDMFLWPTVVTLTMSLGFGILGLFVAAVTLKTLDRFLYPELDFMEEIRKGNTAAALFASALVLFIAYILGSALG